MEPAKSSAKPTVIPLVLSNCDFTLFFTHFNVKFIYQTLAYKNYHQRVNDMDSNKIRLLSIVDPKYHKTRI